MVKRKWGPGNPLWEWKNKHGANTRRKTRHSRGGNMARKKGYRRARGGMGGLLSGRGKIGAMLGMGLIGSIAGGYIGGMLGNMVFPGTLGRLGGAFVGGGPIGAGAVFLAPNLPGQILGGSSTGGSTNDSTTAW